MKTTPDRDSQPGGNPEPDTPSEGARRSTSSLQTTNHDVRIREQQHMLQALRDQVSAARSPLPDDSVAFHVLGMAEPLVVRIESELLLGRFDDARPDKAHLDLTPYNAYALGVSRRHAIIRRRQRDLVIVDLESTNGTLLNGGELKPGEMYRLEDGDEIIFGELVVQVFF